MDTVTRVEIPVAMLEFDIGGNTIWIHNNKGETVLRIKAGRGERITVQPDCLNSCSHADIVAAGGITFCLKE